MIYILVILVIYLFLIAPSFRRKEFVQKKYTHRGHHSEDQSVLENSVQAFELAIKQGYGIELDVRLSKDDTVVVYHDDNLERLHHRDIKVSNLNSEELKEFNIMTLQEVLELVAGRVDLVVELKSGSQNKLLASKVYEILSDYEGSYSIESFDPRIVFWFRKNASDVMRGQLIMPIKQYDNLLLGFLINSMVFHWLTRPHFIALNVKSSLKNPSLIINKLLGAKICWWVVHKEHPTYMKWLDAYIFEYFNA